jgi:dihydrofolate reductase
MKVSMIVACSPDGVIGLNNQIPWKKSADMKRFKAVTMGGTLIMGRKTFDSMGRRQLPGRYSIVVSRSHQADVDTAFSIEAALARAEEVGKPVWVVGGSEIYDLSYFYADEIDLTVVTDYFLTEDSPCQVTTLDQFLMGLPGFTLKSEEQNADDPTLVHRLYVRK